MTIVVGEQAPARLVSDDLFLYDRDTMAHDSRSPPPAAAARQTAFFGSLSPAGGCHVAFNHVTGVRVVIKDRSGRFVWVSDNVPARHGFRDPAEMIGLDDRDINPPALADVYWHDDSSVMESGQPLLAKIEVSFDEAGLPDWFVVNKIPLRDRRGRVCGLIATIVPHHGLAAAPITCTEVVIATAHIKANLGARLRLGDVAALTAVSVRHLQRLFVVSTGLTFSEYVTRCRVMEACRLLRETTMALGRIAIAVGFYDQSAFNRAFVRYVPLRPLAYRKATSRARTALTSPSVRAAPGSRP